MARTELTGRQIKDQSVDLAVDVTGILPVANGGSGADTLPVNALLVGNGNGALQAITPATNGHVLVSNGSAWVAAPPSASTSEVTLDGEETLTNKTLVSPVIDAPAGSDVMVVRVNGSTGFTFNQYGEFFGVAGHGIYYDANISATGFSATGQLNLTSGKGSAGDHDVVIDPSGAGKISLNASVVEADGVQVATTDDLATKEDVLISGTTAQYLRGDKTWQTLDKNAVGLGNVDNTTDLDKPVSTATQTALDGKSDVGHGHAQSDITNLVTDLAAKENVANRGVAGGYASLDGGGKVPVNQLPASLMQYIGTWDADTNTPTLSDGSGDVGDVYRVTVAGVRDLGSGSISFSVGDYAIHNSSGVWEKSDTTDAVASVNGYTGVVSLTKGDLGLGNVENTADLDKPVSTATQTALDGKQDVTGLGQPLGYASLDAAGLVPQEQLPITTASWSTLDGKPAVVAAGATQAEARTAIGLGNVEDTADADKPISTATQAALDGKQDIADKGVANGYASLDASGLVPQEQLPSSTSSDWSTLENKPAVIAAGATEADARSAISAEYTGNKGVANGYASLDSGGLVPVNQVPPGLIVDDVAVVGDSFQFLSGTTAIGDPVSLLIAELDGGTPATTDLNIIDGGTV